MPPCVLVCPECGVEIEERRAAEQMDDPLACPLCGAHCRRLTNFAVTFFRRLIRIAAPSAGESWARQRHVERLSSV